MRNISDDKVKVGLQEGEEQAQTPSQKEEEAGFRRAHLRQEQLEVEPGLRP